MLRLLAPTAGMWRIAKAATALGGVDIPAGAILILRMEPANRDPLKFARPDELDVDRKNRAEHLSFEHGVHYCIGHMLARRALTVAIQKLLERLQNMKIVEEKSDLSSFPNAILRAPKAFTITYDKPAPRQRAAA